MTHLVVIVLLGLLALTALVIVRLRSLFATIMLTGIYSFLGASWMLLLDAPDVAFTEASVGAGIATILMLSTLALTTKEEKDTGRNPILALVIVMLTGAALIYATVDMPLYGDPMAPVHTHVAPRYIEESPSEVGVPNVVTAVLASYRGYDTLGETAVIFTACIAVLLLLRERARRRRRDEP
jgi:multicomponent Na+:H+ antiporter subunit B